MTGPGRDRGRVDPERVRYALRRMRPGCLDVRAGADGGCRVALVMDASPAGRRNAADKIVGYLAAAGLALDAPDPAAALTEPGAELAVRPAGPG